MALLWGCFLAAVCAVIKLPLLDQWKITVSSVHLLKSTDSWNSDSSFHLAGLLVFDTCCCLVFFLCLPISLSSLWCTYEAIVLGVMLSSPFLELSAGWYAGAVKGNTGRWGNKSPNKRARRLNKEKDIAILKEKKFLNLILKWRQ